MGSTSPQRQAANRRESQSTLGFCFSLNCEPCLLWLVPGVRCCADLAPLDAGYHGSTDDSEHSESDAHPRLTAAKQASSRPHPSSKPRPSGNPHPSGKPLPSHGAAGKTKVHRHTTNSLHKKTKTKSQLNSQTTRVKAAATPGAEDTSRRASHRPNAGDSPSSSHPVPHHAPPLRSPAEDRSEKTRLLLEAHGKGRGHEGRSNEATLQVTDSVCKYF